MAEKKDSNAKSASGSKRDLKSSIMDKALGLKSFPKPKQEVKPVSKLISKPKPVPVNSGKKDKSSPTIVVALAVLVVIVSLYFVLSQGTGLDFMDGGKSNGALNKDSNREDNSNNGGVPLTFPERYTDCMANINIHEKDICLQELAVEFNKNELCDDLVNFDKEKCNRLVWKAFVVISKELDNCKSLLTEFDRIECVKEIALASSDKIICGKMNEVVENASSREINSCLIELAMQEKNMVICDEIEGSMNQTCKFTTAIAISDPDLCIVFDLPTIKSDCIARIAKNNNDISLCDRITNSIQKNKCINDLS